MRAIRPSRSIPLGWYFFTPEEVATVEAIVDRLIPADHLSPGGKDAGCAVFIDRQLAGLRQVQPALYEGPFANGLPTQGYQGELTPSGRYRDGLRALNDYARAAHRQKLRAAEGAGAGRGPAPGWRSGKIDLKLAHGLSSRAFFELVLQNTMEGFFADPLYGGNKGMAGWKLIGFPGARYDYRDHIDKHNVPYPHGPDLDLWRGADAMAKLLPRKDVVIMGLGWTGSILAQELTDAGLNVVAIERGPWRDTATDFNIGYMPDELRYRHPQGSVPAAGAGSHDHAQRCHADGAADARLRLLPAGQRRGRRGRALERLHLALFSQRLRSARRHLTKRYGAKKIAELQIQDWGVTYDEIEHCYDRFEYLCGTSGKAGNLKGQVSGRQSL